MEPTSQQKPEELCEEARERPARPRRQYTRPAVVIELPLETRAGSVLGLPTDPADPGGAPTS